jgi:hypothetical protein
MKRFNLLLILVLVVVVTSGCQHGKWRLRGARCRPGLTMPTYAQNAVPAAPATAVAAPCAPGYAPGYPATSYPPPGMAPTGYMPNGFLPGGYPAGAYMPSEGFISEGPITSDGAVQGFQTGPIPAEGTEAQRPYIESAPLGTTTSDVITVPGPEVGPLPNG